MKPIRSNITVKIVLILILAIPQFSIRGLSQSGENLSSKLVPTAQEVDFREKLFLHCDRKIYLTGETIWFKGYCVHRTFNLPVEVSKVMYVEILNDQNKPILSQKVILSEGTGKGSIYLPRSIQTGTYYLRAYTRWMTNYSPEYYFLDRIYVVNPFLPLETINDPTGESDEYSIKLYAEKNRLIPGQSNKIAFQSVDETGKGINLKGWVLNEASDTLTTFNTYKYGFGLISFIPMINNQLRILTISSDGREKEIPVNIPVLQNSPDQDTGEGQLFDERKKFTISLTQNKASYKNREQVIISMETRDAKGQAVSGNMSVSVYKSDKQLGFYQKNIYQYLYHTSLLPCSVLPPDDQITFADYNSGILKEILSIIYSSFDRIDVNNKSLPAIDRILPENRGIMVSGTVFNRQDGNPAPGVRVFLAKPGKETQLYNITSGTDGKFHIQVLDQYGMNDIIMMPEEDPEKYRISMDDDFSDRYGNLKPAAFRPDEQTIRYLEKLMVNLQITDAFSDTVPDHSDIFPYEISNIFGEPDETVLMEDYIRLPAVEELFFELINTVLITRRKDRFSLVVVDPVTFNPLGEPLLLLDGVPVLDIDPVITYLDPIDIEKIEVHSSWYILGDKFYYSIINMITKQADFRHIDLPSYAIRKNFHFLKYPDSFSTPEYSSEIDTLRMIPDYRNLLYWDPEVVTDTNGKAMISFYTSDDISDYSIVIQGLTQEGLAGYKEATITVTGSER